jgi:uracil phosphoribosyltransferase
VILVPVLRAGLGLLDAFLDVLPMSRVGFEGLRRNEDDLTAEQYYQRIPDGDATSTYVVIDPMLATGGSLAATVEALLERPHHAIIATCLIASQPGLDAFERRFPSVRLVVADVDNHLNDKGFIVPGLGDAGDRLFGT